MNIHRIQTFIIITGIIILLVLVAILLLPHQKSRPVVYIVYDSKKGDLSYTDSAYQGIFAAQEAMSFVKREYTSFNDSLLSGKLTGDEGLEKPGLVITVGYDYTEDTKQFADKHTEIHVLGIDQSIKGPDNMKAYEITSYGESYLAGVLAASATKTRRVGIILGTQSKLLDGFRLGYIEGVKVVDPSVTVYQEYVRDNSSNGFFDPVRAAEIARGMYLNGTDIIYTVAGYSGVGAINEAKLGQGRYIIGVDSDQTHLGPAVVIASAIKRVDRVVYAGISDYLNGTFTGGKQVAGLREGVTALSFNPSFSFYNTTINAYQEKAGEAEAKYLLDR